MMLSGKRSATVRALASFGVIAAMGMASQAYAQTPAPAAQAQPPAAPADQMLFPSTVTSAVIVYLVKPDKVSDFESFWNTVRSKIASSTKEDYKTAFSGLKFYKIQADPGASAQNPVTYMFYIEPPAKTSYSPTTILYQSGIFERAEADQLFPQLRDSISQILVWPMTKIGG